jgi:hypothetical protein
MEGQQGRVECKRVGKWGGGVEQPRYLGGAWMVLEQVVCQVVEKLAEAHEMKMVMRVVW